MTSRGVARVLFGLYILVFFAYLFGPLVVMGITAFNTSAYPTVSPFEGFTLDWFGKLAGDKDLMYGLKNSLWIALLVVATSVPVGLAGAMVMAQVHARARSFYYLVVVSPVLTPGVIIGISTVVFWRQLTQATGAKFIYDGVILTVLAQSSFISAYTMLIFLARLARFDRTLEEAALDLGATRLQVFRDILVPFLMPAIGSAAVIAFLSSFENYNTTTFAILADKTLTTVLAGRVRQGTTPSLSALAVSIVGVTVMGAILYEGLKRRESRRAEARAATAAGAETADLTRPAGAAAPSGPSRSEDLPVMIANSLDLIDRASLIHQQTDLAAYDEHGGTIIKRGEGVYIYDEAGNKYLEAMAGLWCASLGFSEKRLADAAYRQMLELPYYHTFFAKSHVPSVELADRLLAIAPKGMSKVAFQCSGSEANDAAIKLIWYYNNALGRPHKKKIIGRIRGYHGNTVASVSASGQPHMQADFDVPLPMFRHTENPHYYRFHQEGETEEAFSTRMADALEQLILAEGPETVAAFFAEPVQGGGGAITPPQGYFQKIQPILKKYDILFLADEVICGFGRTGNMWGSETYDLQPDLVSCAKALSAAYQPISALMISDKIFQAMKSESSKLGTFGHGYTYGGHPVASAVALETLKIYEERDILGHVRKVGPLLQAGLKATEAHPLVGNARGIGLIAGVEIMADKATRIPFAPDAKAGLVVQDEAQKAGLIVRAIGDRIAFTPPLVITAAEIDELLSKFTHALDAALPRLKSHMA